jgi:hypothetical protein
MLKTYSLITMNFCTEIIIPISKLKIDIFPYKIVLMNRIQTSWLQSPLVLSKTVYLSLIIISVAISLGVVSV